MGSTKVGREKEGCSWCSGMRLGNRGDPVLVFVYLFIKQRNIRFRSHMVLDAHFGGCGFEFALTAC